MNNKIQKMGDFTNINKRSKSIGSSKKEKSPDQINEAHDIYAGFQEHNTV